MGAPLLAYVQNIVQKGVCLQSVGDARENCLRAGASYCETAGAGPATAVSCSAALHLGRKGRTFWIGTAILDRLFSYPQRRKLSSSCFPIHFMAARGPDDPHVDPMMRTWTR